MIYLIIRRSTLLIVLLKAGKLAKLTEVGRLFHLIYQNFNFGELSSYRFIPIRFIAVTMTRCHILLTHTHTLRQTHRNIGAAS